MSLTPRVVPVELNPTYSQLVDISCHSFVVFVFKRRKRPSLPAQAYM